MEKSKELPTCDKCRKSYASVYYLHKHAQRCKGAVNPYQCEFCKKEFQHEKSRFKHYNICKRKGKPDVIVYRPYGLEFYKDHLDEATTNSLVRFHPSIERLTMVANYGRAMFQNPLNRCIHKKSLTGAYSTIHDMPGRWVTAIDKEIYPKLATEFANGLAELMNTKKHLMSSIVFKQNISYLDYMAGEGYVNTDDKGLQQEMLKDFKKLTKEVKLLVYDATILENKRG